MPFFVFVITMTAIYTGCAQKPLESYEELVKSGMIEQVARSRHESYFTALEKIGELSGNAENAPKDSAALAAASREVDTLAGHVSGFPKTAESRVALDAFSFGAAELRESPAMDNGAVREFRDKTLLGGIMKAGLDFIKTDDINESAHLQMIQALQRAGGTDVDDLYVKNMITIIGPAPSDKVLSLCDADTLVLKRIHDLILYSRSLQQVDPPRWMLSGNWFLAIESAGWPTIFIALHPLMIGEMPFLTFKDYNLGDVYAAVFGDPVPEDEEKWDAWLTRGNAIMSSLVFDGTLAAQVKNSGLSVHGSHNFYEDYLVQTDVDTTKKEFHLSFVRRKVQENIFEFAGADSIGIVFTAHQATVPMDGIMELEAARITGSSMIGGSFFPGRSVDTKSYLMPLGTHDKTKTRTKPEFGIEVNEPPG